MSKSYYRIDGALNINKPAGMTSHDVVAQVRRLINQKGVGLPAEAQKAKVGHAGTLDPFATGVLLILLGSATRLGEFVLELPKTYSAEFTLGATSDTDDITGKITKNQIPNPKQITKKKIQNVLKQFSGTIEQIPPMYSAVKVQGKKLYEYARIGESVARQRRLVTIFSIELLSYYYPNLEIEVTCSSGTYIRALARDIGQALHIGAYVSHLQRTSIGQFDLTKSVLLDDLTPENLFTYVLPSQELIVHLPAVTVADMNVAKLRRGEPVPLVPPHNQGSGAVGGTLAIFDQHKQLIGIGQADNDKSVLHPKKILTNN